METQTKLAEQCRKNREQDKAEKKNQDPDEVREKEQAAFYEEGLREQQKKEKKSANYGKKPQAKQKKSADQRSQEQCARWYGANKSKPGNPECPYCGIKKNSHKG
jgi:hypothetical protein